MPEPHNHQPFWARHFAHSQLLDLQAYHVLCDGAEVLEQDKHGIKVLRLVNGNILKIFRLKRTLSSAKLYSYARQFYRNALRLQVLGIPTVQVERLYHFAGSTNTAVLYKPLPGHTVRQLIAQRAFDTEKAYRLGAFVAHLHQTGIYFRSLHFGNIVLTPENTFGLIDVADMSIFPWRLGKIRRQRNFKHLMRIKEDWSQLGGLESQAFQQGYDSVI